MQRRGWGQGRMALLAILNGTTRGTVRTLFETRDTPLFPIQTRLGEAGWSCDCRRAMAISNHLTNMMLRAFRSG
jgi:hypothetical protein